MAGRSCQVEILATPLGSRKHEPKFCHFHVLFHHLFNHSLNYYEDLTGFDVFQNGSFKLFNDVLSSRRFTKVLNDIRDSSS